MAVTQEQYDEHLAVIPDDVPKDWLTVCAECLFTYIPSFKVRECPVCHPGAAP